MSGNRKNMHVFLTDPGRALQKKLVPLAEEVNRISGEGISEASIAQLRSTLLTMIENLVKAEAQAMLAEKGTSDAV
jgi:DNA-binding MarR family transcriptional regulator